MIPRALALVALTACGRFGFGDADVDGGDGNIDANAGDATDATDATVIDAVDAPPNNYHATAVRFTSAGNDYLSMNALAGATGSKTGVYSVWIRLTAGDGAAQNMTVAMVAATGGISRGTGNRFHFVFLTCAPAPLLDMTTQNTFTVSSGWVHLLAAWDLAASKAQIYVNDMPDLAAGATVIDGGNICYNANKWGLGGISSGSLDADVADLYALQGAFLDLDVVANRRKFDDGFGKPIDLGSGCSGPTGTSPMMCNTGALAQWQMNKGTGGGMTANGDGLTLAPTSPSD